MIAAEKGLTVALLGDVMVGGQVGERLASGQEVFAPEIAAVLAEADLVVANLECCVTTSTRRWSSPTKRFYFRAPPVAAEVLADLGVHCVSLANNHSMDFGAAGLLDTITRLSDVGIDVVGAGENELRAKAPLVLDVAGVRVGLTAVTDHPAEITATPSRPGVAFANLQDGVPSWLMQQAYDLGRACDVVIVLPHWGPNFARTPVPHVLRAARRLAAAATLVAGHSAHVCQGAAGRVLYDLGDLIDDYPPHPLLRLDLGAIWLIEVTSAGPVRANVVPTVNRDGVVRLATGHDRRQFADALTVACSALGSEVDDHSGRLVVDLERAPASTAVVR